jgi:acyl-CoA synthetase (AMP-forming)/AMP-acid ligase II
MSDHTENLAYQLYLVAQRNRNHLAIIQDENKVTYGQFIQAVFAFTKKLKQHGVRQGSVLVIDTGDTVTLLAFMFATAFLGAKWARADKFLASSRVIKPSHFFRSPDKKGSKARDFILIDDSWSVEQTKPTVSAEELSNAAIPEGHWIYTHTSGTTGVPKFLGWTQKMVLLRSRASKIDFVERQTRFACLFGNTARPFISRAIAAMLSGSTLVDSQDISLWRRAGVNFVMGSPNQVADHLLGQKLSPRIPILHVGGGKLKDSLVPELLRPCCTDHPEFGARPTRDGFQAVRSKLGRPSPVIRLSIWTPILASVF